MQVALVNFIFSFAVSALTIACLLPVSRRLNWLDRPDERKQHLNPTPPIGGFGVLLGIMIPVFWMSGLTQQTLGFAVGGFFLVMVGALDDKFDLNWKIRILAQTVAALSMIYISGVRAEHVGPLFGFGDIELGWLSVPFSVFVTLGLINALNMFDGIDGLVGAVCFAVVSMFVAASLYADSPSMAVSLFCVLGAIAGFLLFNMRFPWQSKAKVFLGDAGSGFIGFTLAYITFSLTQPPMHPISPILGPFMLAPPVIDCLVLIAHRIRKGKSPFSAGRDHGHYLMLDAGFTVNEIVRFMLMLSCLFGLFAALAMIFNVPAPLLVMAYMLAMFFWFWITGSNDRADRYFRWLHQKIYK